MKRFGTYESDFANLFECYTRVNTTLVERSLPSDVRKMSTVTTGLSFEDLQVIKIYQAKLSGGGELTHVCKGVSIQSDDGAGNVIISCKNQDKLNVQIVTSDNNTTVRLIYPTGEETKFDTSTPLQYDKSSGVLTIINPSDI